jgi:hypothetical protein
MATTWQSHGNHIAITSQSHRNHIAITSQSYRSTTSVRAGRAGQSHVGADELLREGDVLGEVGVSGVVVVVAHLDHGCSGVTT